MSKLPSMAYGSRIAKAMQIQFGGLRHTRDSADGELHDMRNLSCREYPVLQPRGPRYVHDKTISYMYKPVQIYADNGDIWYINKYGDVGILDKGKPLFMLDLSKHSAEAVKMIRFGDRIVIMPHKILINAKYRIIGMVEEEFPADVEKGVAVLMYDAVPPHVDAEIYGYDLYVFDGEQWQNAGKLATPLEAEIVTETVTIQDGTIYEEPATANTMVFPETWQETLRLLFKVGDGVTISGLTTMPENNKTAIIREIDGAKLVFSDNCFKMPLEGDTPATSYTEEGTIKISRTVPDMEFCFEHDNRLWGASDKEIFASKIGDPTNWNVFEGLSTDAWYVETQKKGKLTGGISYGGYPTFFREDSILRVYGVLPSAFQISEQLMPGVKDGEHGSLGIAGGTLFYLSRDGMTAYGESYPQSMESVFGVQQFHSARGCSDGTRYYVQLHTADGEHALYCCDMSKGLWMKEDSPNLVCMAYMDGVIYGLNEKYEIFTITGGNAFGVLGTAEEPVKSFAEFGDFLEGSLNRKAVSRIQLRVEIEEGASMNVKISYDGEPWLTVWELRSGRKRSLYLPVNPRRCDHYRIRIEGVGMWHLYAMAREFYTGSERL